MVRTLLSLLLRLDSHPGRGGEVAETVDSVLICVYRDCGWPFGYPSFKYLKNDRRGLGVAHTTLDDGPEILQPHNFVSEGTWRLDTQLEALENVDSYIRECVCCEVGDAVE